MHGLTRTVLVSAGLALCLLNDVATQAPSQGRFAQPVTITEAQASLLAAEANRLATQIGQTRQQLAPLEARGAWPAVAQALSTRTTTESRTVSATQERFLNLPGSNVQRQAAQTFFNDFVRRYSDLSRELTPFQPAIYPPVKDRAVELLEDNERAYRQVAASRSLTFTLEVRSVPSEAFVDYKRTGDSYQRHGRRTTATLENIEFAVWTVRATLGNKMEEQTHNPYRESNHILVFDLRP